MNEDLYGLWCRETDLRYSYGITLEQYNAMAAKQGGGCAVCGQSPRGTGLNQKRLHVDHDHSCCSGKKKTCGRCLRGLLCSNCNIAMGLLNDDPEKLRALASYLEDYSKVVIANAVDCKEIQ